MTESSKLLDVLNKRYSIAKSFSEDYRKEVEMCLKDYKCQTDDGKDSSPHDQHVSTKRYKLTIPYIYSTHESMLASLFEKMPELVISGKGSEDDEKANLIKAIYKYLYDKLDLDEYLHNVSWWFILVGFISSYQTYKIEMGSETPVLDEMGQPMIDENGEPLTTPEYKYHDPIAVVDDPTKVHFAPDSEYTLDGKKMPYILREKLMSREEVKAIYDVELETNQSIDVSNLDDDEKYKEELGRIKIFYYYGQLPENIEEIENWSYEKNYFIVFTKNKVLIKEEQDKHCTLAKWFGSPNEFFGFGIGKTLRSSQREMTMRRNQQIRYADLYAYPWLLVDQQTTIDQNALMDYQKRKPLVYSNKPPEYLVPPPMPQTLVSADETARSDAQFISGTLDLSKGAQQTNTVNTATGQQLFSQSQEKRIEKAKKIIAKHFREVVINLFKLCRDNWDEAKIISITDDDENTVDYEVTGVDLEDINFDTDIDITLGNVTINKEAIAERSISLYDKVKDDPLVDRKAIFKKMLKDGFGEKNPDNFMVKEEEMGEQPNMEPQEGMEEIEMGKKPEEEPSIGEVMAPQPKFYG